MTRLDTKMEGLDIVSAITQSTINSQFAAFRRLNIIPDQLEVDLPRRLGKLKVHLLAPTVTVGLEDKPRQILFSQPFSSGVFSTVKDNGDPVDIPFDAGVLAFLVDVNLSHMNPQDAPNSVRDAIKNVGAGAFSMRQLYLDFENAVLASYDPKHTTLPKVLLDDALFMAGLTMLFRELRLKGGNVLGYAITVTNPNDVVPEAPTFPPTDIDFSTHIFLDPVTGQRNADLDTLNYLLMTQHRPFPKTLPTGNFAEGNSAGTMAISRSVFTEGFLLPKVANATNLTSSFTSLAWTGATLETKKGGAFRAAGSAPDETFEKLVERIEQTVTGVIENGGQVGHAVGGDTRPDPTATRWVFESAVSSEKTEPNYPIWGSSMVVAGVVCHLCEMKIDPGSNEIALRGVSALGTSWTIWAGVVGFAMYELHTLRSQFKWQAKLKLISDSTGTVKPQLDFLSDPVKSEAGGNWVGKIGNWAYPEQANWQLGEIRNELDLINSSDSLASALANVFSANNKFIFPGGNQYFFKNLEFNKKILTCWRRLRSNFIKKVKPDGRCLSIPDAPTAG